VFLAVILLRAAWDGRRAVVEVYRDADLEFKAEVALGDSLPAAAVAPHRALAGHGGPIAALALSADGKLLLAASTDLRLWDVERGEVRRRLSEGENVRTAAFSPDGRLALSAGDEGVVRLWDVAAGTLHGELTGHARVRAAAFSPDGRQLLSGSDDAAVRLWDVPERRRGPRRTGAGLPPPPFRPTAGRSSPPGWTAGSASGTPSR
jgi:WD40 repeat protein